MEIRRGVHGITPEVVRTFRQDRIRAKTLPATAAGAFVRWEPTAIDREAPEELDMLQLSETTPYVIFDDIKKAIKAERETGQRWKQILSCPGGVLVTT